jgi:hypothetical protein
MNEFRPGATWVIRRTFPGLSLGPERPYRVSVAGKTTTVWAGDDADALREGQRRGEVTRIHEGRTSCQ